MNCKQEDIKHWQFIIASVFKAEDAVNGIELLEKLKEEYKNDVEKRLLMEIKTKFNNGDRVFVMHENSTKQGEVYCIETRVYGSTMPEIYYNIKLDERKPVLIGIGENYKLEHIAQRKVYATKKELIEDL